MLQTFDTVIAFAVIMTVLSLLITIVVQMLSTWLALRGKNLANALALTFQTIDPRLKEHAHALAEHILKDPIFSDSVFQQKDRGRAAARPASRRKPWSFWDMRLGRTTTLASAVRPGEVYRLLYELKDLEAEELKERGIPASMKKHAVQLFAELRKTDGPTKEAREKLESLAEVAGIFAQAVGHPTPELEAKVVEALDSFGNTLERATTHSYERFQRWFGSAQDRAQQWFMLHVRGITIAASVLTAFLLQLDTIEMFRQLRSNPQVVRALVESAPVLLEKQALASAPATTGTAEDATALLERQRQVMQTLSADIENAGFDLIPAQFLGRWNETPRPHWTSHLAGMFITAGLLTLGAPFWFNLLKNLMSLRPAVARIMERRPQSAPALPSAPLASDPSH